MDYFYAIRKLSFVFLFVLVPCVCFGQGNGAPWAFQGMSTPNNHSPRGLAMGGAYTAKFGALDAIYYNSAGLAQIENMQIFISGKAAQYLQRENQYWVAERRYPLLSSILEGRIKLDPAYNNIEDDSLFTLLDPDDIAPVINGEDNFSEKAADWQKENSNQSFSSAAIAIPFNLLHKDFTFAASYNVSYDVYDFDRNDTNLDPHVGDGNDPRIMAQPDSITVPWARYQRERKGSIYDITGALATRLNKNIYIGVSFRSLSGKTDDEMNLDNIAYIDFTSTMRLRYDNTKTATTGSSNFSASVFSCGLGLTFNRFNAGLRVNMPYMLKRDWDYNVTTTTDSTTDNLAKTGTDEVKLPATYTLGINIQPLDNFSVSFDYQYNPYSKAEFKYAEKPTTVDTLAINWVDQSIMRFGVAWQIMNNVTVMGGYSSVPQTFIPAKAADRERGPEAESVTAGLSFNILWGQLDIAYEYRKLKYFEAWETNLNYVYLSEQNIVLGYTYIF